jgi:hypothetical protein
MRMGDTELKESPLNDEILVDPAGIASVANRIGGSLEQVDLGPLPDISGCGSSVVAGALTMFEEALQKSTAATECDV